MTGSQTIIASGTDLDFVGYVVSRFGFHEAKHMRLVFKQRLHWNLQRVIKMIADEDEPIPSENPRVSFEPIHTRIYADGWVVS